MTRRVRPKRLVDYAGLQRDVERVVSERREFAAMTPQVLAASAQVTLSDIADALTLWRDANAGEAARNLLDATPWEGPWDATP